MADELVYQEYESCPKKDEIQVMGPDSEHVCLISKDGDRFAVKRSHATQLATHIYTRLHTSTLLRTYTQLAGMMTRPGAAEGEVNEINLTDISTHTLKIVCQYLDYKEVKHTWPESSAIPDFEIKKEDAIDVLLVANFLDI